ncbi:uncharacterized protein N7496_000771 [Penicillium cataractarum]|uniref:Arf-GAP domain-containing protein n=1 Tax=Penicillium cataractarum TaxID=2100454 RepID=A0A9X0B698_9EURO|nr:uncharacterized protein N7496_000771 [Penicillium cataractarum]KAJ5389703.1 hypothetical protein N7496_000771 [Penicillium cataractarum]
MPSGISKRQQQRNEKALADLIRTVPGNDRCADCDALTPGWASWNMGIFLCMRCAAIHRKLGTHISKVKSLSMDTWSSEQVDNMKSHGNLLMNKIFNPKNIKPPVPTDIDEADSCMERFIRQKYQYRSLEDGKPKPPSREDESYTRSHDRREERRERQRSYDDSHRNDISPEGSPPPLPPKSGKFFGFGLRSASSTSNLRRFGNKSKGSMSPTSDQRSWSPPPRQTSGLGAPVADVTTASFEAKMAALRDMGFDNDRRNEMVLRGLNENLDKSIETLVRLGEGNKQASRAKTPVPTNNTATSAGALVAPKPAASPNPFDMPTATTGNQVSQQPHSTSYNPFDRPAQIQTPQPAQPLEASFQNLQVSQPLFPHSTGGYPAQTGLMPQATYQQPITPPVTSTFSQNGYVSSPQAMDSNYNPFFQPVAQPQGGMGAQSFPNPSAPQSNPFFNTTPQTQNQNPYLQPQAQQNGASVQSMTVPRQPQHANTMPAISSASPFGTSPFGTSPLGQAPSFQTQPQQQQQQLQQPQQFQPQAQATAAGSYNPFQQSMGPQSTGAYPNQLQPQQPQQLMPQHTARMDKSSILSLYSLNQAPPTIPSIPEQSQYQFQPGAGTSPVPPLTHSLISTPMTQPGSTIQTPQPSANGPAMASRNPFGAATVGSGLAAQAGVSAFPPSSGLGIGMGTNGIAVPAQANGMKTSPFSGPPPVNTAFPRSHMSQPSVDINGLQSGRHSPDAFASLSARYG